MCARCGAGHFDGITCGSSKTRHAIVARLDDIIHSVRVNGVTQVAIYRNCYQRSAVCVCVRVIYAPLVLAGFVRRKNVSIRAYQVRPKNVTNTTADWVDIFNRCQYIYQRRTPQTHIVRPSFNGILYSSFLRMWYGRIQICATVNNRIVSNEKNGMTRVQRLVSHKMSAIWSGI